MDPEYNLQDVARCNDCETPIPPSYCRSCEKNLCKDCLVKHVLDDSKGHKVVPFERRKSLTYCQKHSTKLNDLYCELCNKPICKLCASSKEHEDHNTVDILKRLELQEKFIHNDIQELNTLRQENYEKCQRIISVLKDFLNKHTTVRHWSYKITRSLYKGNKTTLYCHLNLSITKWIPITMVI